MKTTAVVTLAAMLGSIAWAAAKTDDQKVVACFDVSGSNAMEVAVAKMAASALFRSAGVKLEWHTDRRSCNEKRDQAIIVSLSMDTPKNLRPGALAIARPFGAVSSGTVHRSGASPSPQSGAIVISSSRVVVSEVGQKISGGTK